MPFDLSPCGCFFYDCQCSDVLTLTVEPRQSSTRELSYCVYCLEQKMQCECADRFGYDGTEEMRENYPW
jgi:hypothetical protein